MYCVNCGTKNPDGARFCSNCGNAMGSVPVAQTKPVQKNTTPQKSGGIFKRIITSAIAFVLFYSIGYAVTSLTSGNKSASKDNVRIESEFVSSSKDTYIDPVQPEIAAQPETGYIADLGGYWEQVSLKDGNFNLNVSALTFSQTVYDCTGFTVNMDVTMNAGTSCKDWQVWGRSGSTFVKIAKIYLPDGDGYTSQSVTFKTPVTFDSIAVTPTIVGGYSWSMGLSITDVYTE